jgi:hypothetical protein
VEECGTGQSSAASRSRLATIPAVCRSGNLNNTFIDRQNWIAASEKIGTRRMKAAVALLLIMRRRIQ